MLPHDGLNCIQIMVGHKSPLYSCSVKPVSPFKKNVRDVPLYHNNSPILKWCDMAPKNKLILYNYPLIMTNIAMERSTIFKKGKASINRPSIPWQTVSHNQRVS